MRLTKTSLVKNQIIDFSYICVFEILFENVTLIHIIFFETKTLI